MVMDLVAVELDRVHERIGRRFARAEPRARVRDYVSGLVAGLERKNGWTLAERAGEVLRARLLVLGSARTAVKDPDRDFTFTMSQKKLETCCEIAWRAGL